MKDQNIFEIFKMRDTAVKTKKKDLFLSTQINNVDIGRSLWSGYLELSDLVSRVLYIHHEEKSENLWIVFVKEEYYKNKKFTHAAYLLYYVTKIGSESKISAIVG